MSGVQEGSGPSKRFGRSVVVVVAVVRTWQERPYHPAVRVQKKEILCHLVVRRAQEEMMCRLALQAAEKDDVIFLCHQYHH